MPANLTPQYLEAEQRFKQAETNAEKLKALRHMMAIIPKHKGTEKLRAEQRRKLSRLQAEIEAERSRKSGGRPSPGHVPHEGAGQIALLGAPNCGKSSLLAALSHARPKIAAYPFTTIEPLAGMMDFEDVKVQLVDTPAVSADFMEPWITEILRNADRTLVVVDLGNDALLEDLEILFKRLSERRTRFHALASSSPDEERTDWIETLVAANKSDEPGAEERLVFLREMLAELMEGSLPASAIHVCSAQTGAGLDDLRRVLFDALRVVRVYSKAPGHKPDLEKPFVVPQGATVHELAEVIHKDIAASMRSARIWGSAKFDGQPVHHDHVLEDGDIIEIHT